MVPGEPSDEMVAAIYNDMPKDVTRIIAVGGGTVVDIAKVLSLKTVTPILDLYDGKIPLEKGKELSWCPPPAAPAVRSPTCPSWP